MIVAFSFCLVAGNLSDSTNAFTPKIYTNFILGTGYLALNTSGAGIKYCGSLRGKKMRVLGLALLSFLKVSSLLIM
jgi:hypothetical protein